MSKKYRKCISVEEKMTILQRVDSHVGSRVQLATDLGLSTSTLHTIVKNRSNIEATARQCGPMAKKRKYIRSSAYDDLDKLVAEWFVTTRASGIPLDGSILREKALQFAGKLGITNFTASNGWICRFKTRHNIVYNELCGESASVDSGTVDQWKKELQDIIKDYDQKNIFNVDETGLFYNILPSKTLCFKGEKCHGGKLSKQRITVLLVVNADGSEKLPPLVIGKFKKPRCFKNLKTLPTNYESNKTAWMTSSIFTATMHALDAKMGAKNRKILLILDRCPAHPDNLKLRNIKLLFLPPNCTSELQPLDLGIIHSFKWKYRKMLVQKAVFMHDNGMDPKSMNVSLLDAMHYVAKAWLDVTPLTISNCFKKAGIKFTGETQEPQEEGLSEPPDFSVIDISSTFQDYVGVDASVITSAVPTVDSIIDKHFEEEKIEQDGEEDNEDDDQEPVVPTSKEAMEAINILRQYIGSASGDDNAFDALYSVERQVQLINKYS